MFQKQQDKLSLSSKSEISPYLLPARGAPASSCLLAILWASGGTARTGPCKAACPAVPQIRSHAASQWRPSSSLFFPYMQNLQDLNIFLTSLSSMVNVVFQNEQGTVGGRNRQHDCTSSISLANQVKNNQVVYAYSLPSQYCQSW